jgi:anthranilate phosphoribosyltransferase
MISLAEITKRFEHGVGFSSDEAEPLLDAMIASEDEQVLSDVLRAWDKKGITANEIYALAKILRERSINVHSRYEIFVDIVGTGGSTAKTFNVSTAAAFVVAGAGVPVAKHGNRAATSSSGSSDVLAELNVKPDVEPEVAERCLNELGICFMFAPKHHRLSPTLARVRRGLGFPTIFNCVGPLCNPANVPFQVIGVWNNKIAPVMAEAARRLGTKRSWVVNGYDNLDEISMAGHTIVLDVQDETQVSFEVRATDVGIDNFSYDLPKGSSAKDSASIIRSILSNEVRETDAEKLVALNAAAAIHVAGQEPNLSSAYQSAIESIRSGNAMRKLEAVSEMTTK